MLGLGSMALVVTGLQLVAFYLGISRDVRSLSFHRRIGMYAENLTTDSELSELSETLFALDRNMTFDLEINLQNQTKKGNRQDVAQERLFSDNKKVSWKTIDLVQKLYDNYQANVTVADPYLAEHRQEEDEFLDAIIESPVMQKTYEFLLSKNKAPNTLEEFKELLRLIWFTTYSRAPGVSGSSGFEHVFLGELKKKAPIGIHSWLFYRKEELEGRMNYLGYMQVLDLGKAKLIEMPMSWYSLYKPISSIFVGTTPEFEMALYTLCFRVRRNSRCPLTANGKSFSVRSYSIKGENGTNLVATAFPLFEK